MVEPRGQAELWRLLRQATVRLADPAHPAHWGTGFFIASDVLLTCWHVGRDVADQRLLVQRPPLSRAPRWCSPCRSRTRDPAPAC